MNDVVTGLAWLALVGGGFYALLLGIGARVGQAHPRERARHLGWICALVALAGAVVLLLG